MSNASPGDKKKAKKRRRARHKRRMRAAKARRRAEKECRPRQRGPEPEFNAWPDSSHLSEEEAARVWGESFYWEEYFDRNPGATSAPPLSELTVGALRNREGSGPRNSRR